MDRPSSPLDPSPCTRCHRPCRSDRCGEWVIWFSRSWQRLREMLL